MKILVTGARGQLGQSLQRVGKNTKGADTYIFVDAEELDITNAMDVERWMDDTGADVIVNCAAYTNVDAAEDNIETASAVNEKGVENLAKAALTHNAFLIHISTDYVFGGNVVNTPCAEDETPNPIGVYGFTKLRGEEAITQSGVSAIIIRTSWLYSEYGHNFLKTMLTLTESKPELKVVFDQTGTPTYAGDLARLIYSLIENRCLRGNEGVYNFSNEGVCSWFDFAREIAMMSNHNGCRILPCLSSEFKSKVKRPHYSVLDKSKIRSRFGIEIPYWRDSLATCLANIKEAESRI